MLEYCIPVIVTEHTSHSWDIWKCGLQQHEQLKVH